MTIEIITAVLAIIEQAVVMLGASSNTVTLVDSIISGLQKIIPLIVNSFPTLLQSVKNIIAALSSDPSTLPVQLAALQQLDAVVDAAFEAAAKDVDPDAMPITT